MQPGPLAPSQSCPHPPGQVPISLLPGGALQGPRRPRASGPCGLGLGSRPWVQCHPHGPAQPGSVGRDVMSLPRWSGSRLFQSAWGGLWSLRPIGSADWWDCLLTHWPSEKGPSGSPGELSPCWAHGPATLVWYSPFAYPSSQWPGSGLSGYRQRFGPACLWRVRPGGVDLPSHSAGPECQASHTCPSASGSPTAVLGLPGGPPASRVPPSSVMPFVGCVPSLLTPSHAPPPPLQACSLCSPARPPPRLLGCFPLMIFCLSASPSAVLGPLLCGQGFLRLSAEGERGSSHRQGRTVSPQTP